jgi:elongation factor Ts
MSTITAQDISKLRKQTGQGMMDCRAALQETNGDFEAAVDFLRKKGAKVAAKRSDRDANEGIVLAKTNESGNIGITLNVTSETDFVAKNDDFIAFGNQLIDIAVSNDCKTIEDFKNADFEGIPVSEKILEQVGKIGEKIDVTTFERVEADYVAAYNHGGNRVAVLVGMTQAEAEAGKDVAMQIAAMNPVALNRDSVSPEQIEREKNVIMDSMKSDPKMEGKPEEMLSKIAEGKLGAFFKENTLMAQPFVKDGSKSVEQFLKDTNAALKLTEFKRLAIG